MRAVIWILIATALAGCTADPDPVDVSLSAENLSSEPVSVRLYVITEDAGETALLPARLTVALQPGEDGAATGTLAFRDNLDDLRFWLRVTHADGREDELKEPLPAVCRTSHQWSAHAVFDGDAALDITCS